MGAVSEIWGGLFFLVLPPAGGCAYMAGARLPRRGCACHGGGLRNTQEEERFVLWEKISVPCGHGGCSLFVVWAACAAGGKGKSLSFGRRFLCPAGTGACSLFAIWAACAAGGRRGPVRGCRPSEAPSALPPDDPAGLSIYRQSPDPLCVHFDQSCWAFQLPPACEGCASFAPGASLAMLG